MIDFVVPLWEKASSFVTLYTVLLVLLCITGDYICSSLPHHPVMLRAAADSLTHGMVGVMAWAVVVTPGLSLVLWWHCMLCGLLACIIDVDHFLQAGSWQLKDALSLQERPPLHATTTVVLLSVTMCIVSLVMKWPLLRKASVMCAVAWLSHHLRDSNRRGLWLPPLGTTPPLPYGLYVFLVAALAVTAQLVFSAYCKLHATGVLDTSQISEIVAT